MNLFDKNIKILVIGVSKDPSKFGNKIFFHLLNKGFNVIGFGREKFHEKIFSNLEELPEVDLAIVVIPPQTQDEILPKIKAKKFWFQPGSESIWVKKLNGISGLCYVVDGLKDSLK
jgi:predicted CoA-binding protein